MRWQTSILIGITSALLAISAVLKQTIVLVDPHGTSQSAPPAQCGNEYVFAMFHDDNDEARLTMWQTLEAALAQHPGQARAVNIRVNDPAMKTVVDRYGVGCSRLPLALAIAPNGAVTGAFAAEVTEQDVAGAFVSPSQAACMKGEQTRQLVSLFASHSTTPWPTISTWSWLMSRPATSNPAIVNRCCSCFKNSAERNVSSQLTEHLLHQTDYCLLTDKKAVSYLLSVNITATK
ncbi:MAG TPA: hypothetical protein VH592_13425 [Gemmataceae bacterium]|jgi:hypothetical protein